RRRVSVRHPDLQQWEARVRLHRFLVPLAAGIIILGVVVAVIMRPTGNNSNPKQSGVDVAELLTLKGQAEALAIEGRLSESHAKYRQLFEKAQNREINDPHFWDLL